MMPATACAAASSRKCTIGITSFRRAAPPCLYLKSDALSPGVLRWDLTRRRGSLMKKKERRVIATHPPPCANPAPHPNLLRVQVSAAPVVVGTTGAEPFPVCLAARTQQDGQEKGHSSGSDLDVHADVQHEPSPPHGARLRAVWGGRSTVAGMTGGGKAATRCFPAAPQADTGT